LSHVWSGRQSSILPIGDLAFKVDFVPEPSAYFAVTAVGLAGFVVLRRVRRS